MSTNEDVEEVLLRSEPSRRGPSAGVILAGPIDELGHILSHQGHGMAMIELFRTYPFVED